MMTTRLFFVLALLAPNDAALLSHYSPMLRSGAGRAAATHMCAPQRAVEAQVDVGSAANELRAHLGLELVQSFVAATERADAKAAMELCTTDLLYKTHRATTETLSAAEERFHSKVPAPSQVTTELHEESPNVFVREIVVKPIPFVTVAVRQEFEVRCFEEGVALCRAEFIKV